MSISQNVFRFRDREISLGSRTYIMGIINVTPDSFSDGGDNFTPENAVKTAIQMEKYGADILDIGGQSTRPGHTPISSEEEWERLRNVLPLILQSSSLPVSVDTFYPDVAEKALELGCHIINDVSGIVSSEMAEVVKAYGAGWVLMHNGNEKCDDICAFVHKKLEDMFKSAVDKNIEPSNLCLDPGIGFGKTMEQNYELIAGTKRVKKEGTAFLLGASRKRVIGAAMDIDIPFKERDPGTVAAHTVGIMGGADILRVHDVKGAVLAARVTDRLLFSRKEN